MMNPIPAVLLRFLRWWFLPHSTDPTVLYRERALRIILPVIAILRMVAIIRSYTSDSPLPNPYFPLSVTLLLSLGPLVVAFIFMAQERVNWAGGCFLAHWYFADFINLPAEGYWYPGFHISLVMQVILGAVFLRSHAILPFLAFQLVTVGAWGYWLDVNYFNPPNLASGEPLSVFHVTFITIAAQETIILFIVRYLRVEMEKALLLQQTTIQQLQVEVRERHHAEEQIKQLNLELEQRVRERTADLEAANKELEAFSYSISHDLRAPLRAINGFTKILGEDFAANLPPVAQGFLQKIIVSGKRMSVLIDELLDFSRLGRKPLNRQLVNPQQLIQSTREALTPETANRQIEWILPENMSNLQADPVLLEQVYVNLLGNAVKYTGKQELARIEAGQFVQNGETVYFVRDNGAGFDMQYADKLFVVFQRLHRDDEFEGTGIGLATVRRIIERHGGRIWAESEVGKGASFYFTWPGDEL